MILCPPLVADFDMSWSDESFGKKFKNSGATHTNDEESSRRITEISPDTWSYEDVAVWLVEQGFQKYADLIAYKHKIDGRTLLMLTETDLREKPLELSCLGDIKRIASSISLLRDCMTPSFNQKLFAEQSAERSGIVSLSNRSKELLSSADCRSQDNADIKFSPDTNENEHFSRDITADPSHERRLRRVQLLSGENLIRQVESPDTKSKSLIKLAIAFCYCTSSLLITSFVMALVHDRVPDMKTYPPLPDIVLDNLPLIPWAFQVCEVIAVCLALLWFTILFFHKHRVVIMRRMFSLIGTVFLLRCVTMLITSLSVPGVHLECRSQSYGTMAARLQQAYHIWSHFGMSIHGVRSCGDYMFSGHATAITLINHFITEYTPDSWHNLHTFTWVLNLFGIFFILAGHEHYSIDVFIAFYISSRMFLYYHAYAYRQFSLVENDNRMRLWFPLGWFFEAGGQGRVKNDFDFPFYLPVISLSSLCEKLSMQRKGTKSDQKLAEKITRNSNSISVDFNKNLKRRKNGKK
ncbi:unnamed protein product [Thelazia callipaeda]|uniref:SAM domain-containing protein n=1 Tax=Thelazia callipaeda TaxID=103827 RepID=A0A158RBE7_THECL|nr:unnamed protein product [Thelazia callipaeda]